MFTTNIEDSYIRPLHPRSWTAITPENDGRKTILPIVGSYIFRGNIFRGELFKLSEGTKIGVQPCRRCSALTDPFFRDLGGEVEI